MDFDIGALVPRFIMQDRNGHALAKAIEAALKYFLAAVGQGIACVQDVDTMPEWRLDEMAWELNVQWYDNQASASEKRQTIRDAREIYARLGTHDAVVRAVNGVFGQGRLEEWWQYGGSPYHFRVYTPDYDALEERYALFTRMVAVAANVRSVLDGVYYVGADGTATLWPATAAIGGEGRASATAINYS